MGRGTSPPRDRREKETSRLAHCSLCTASPSIPAAARGPPPAIAWPLSRKPHALPVSRWPPYPVRQSLPRMGDLGSPHRCRQRLGPPAGRSRAQQPVGKARPAAHEPGRPFGLRRRRAEAAPRVTLQGICGSARCALSGKAGRSGPGRWARAGGPGGAPPPPRPQASLRLGRPEGGGPTSWCLTLWLWLPLENQCPTLGPGPRGLASLFRGQSARASSSGPRGSLAGGGFKSCNLRWAEGLGRGVLCFHEWPCR